MPKDALLYSLVIVITSIFWVVCCAVAYWTWGSPSTRRPKLRSSDEPTLTSGHLARLEADQAALFAALEKTQTTVKRLSSRAGMRDLRERGEKPDEPPLGTSKAELRKHYGLTGKSPSQVAELQRASDRSMQSE